MQCVPRTGSDVYGQRLEAAKTAAPRCLGARTDIEYGLDLAALGLNSSTKRDGRNSAITAHCYGSAAAQQIRTGSNTFGRRSAGLDSVAMLDQGKHTACAAWL
jgi:hypothetical protein